MKKLSLLLLFIFWCPLIIHSQGMVQDSPDDSSLLKKNSVYGNLGVMVPLFAGSASMSYDRGLFITQDNTDIRGKVSIGYLSTFGGSYSYQSLNLGLLTGNSNHRLELFAGTALNQYHPSSSPGDSTHEKSSKGIFPAGNIGYRFQKPDGWFLFRTGAGFPDLVYIGAGIAF